MNEPRRAEMKVRSPETKCDQVRGAHPAKTAQGGAASFRKKARLKVGQPPVSGRKPLTAKVAKETAKDAKIKDIALHTV